MNWHIFILLLISYGSSYSQELEFKKIRAGLIQKNFQINSNNYIDYKNGDVYISPGSAKITKHRVLGKSKNKRKLFNLKTRPKLQKRRKRKIY